MGGSVYIDIRNSSRVGVSLGHGYWSGSETFRQPSIGRHGEVRHPPEGVSTRVGSPCCDGFTSPMVPEDIPVRHCRFRAFITQRRGVGRCNFLHVRPSTMRAQAAEVVQWWRGSEEISMEVTPHSTWQRGQTSRRYQKVQLFHVRPISVEIFVSWANSKRNGLASIYNSSRVQDTLVQDLRNLASTKSKFWNSLCHEGDK